MRAIRSNNIRSYILMFSTGTVIGAFFELFLTERAVIASAVTMGVFWVVIHRINHVVGEESIFTKALLAMFAITAFELIGGVIINRIMHLDMWNFSDRSMHVLGQICPSECVLRFITAIPIIYISTFIDRSIVPYLNGGPMFITRRTK